MRAFDVFLLQSNPESIDTGESADSVLKGVIHHSHDGYFVIQNAPNRFKTGLALISVSTAIHVTSDLSVQFVIPKFRDAHPS